MKKFYLVVLTLFIMFTTVQTNTAQAASVVSNWLNTSKLQQGIIGINYDVSRDKLIKLMITKGNSSYTYNLNSSGNSEDVPLQQGNGKIGRAHV